MLCLDYFILLIIIFFILCVNGYIWHPDNANVSFQIYILYVSISVYVFTWFGVLLFFFTSILTNLKWFQEQLDALRHAWYCENSTHHHLFLTIQCDRFSRVARKQFYLIYYCKRVFFALSFIAWIFHLMKRREKKLSFKWYACMVIAPYLICCWSWFFLYTDTCFSVHKTKLNETNVLTQTTQYKLICFFFFFFFHFAGYNNIQKNKNCDY